MKVQLVIGDWSGDGHCQKVTLYYDINKTLEEVKSAYIKSCELAGFDLDDCCSDYLKNTISKERIDKLVEIGIDYLKDIDENYRFTWDEFSDLVFDFIKLSLPDLVNKNIQIEEPPHLLNRDFGYGLFRD